MDNKYIKLRFSNAKLFPKNNETKDIVANVAISKGNLIFKHSRRSDEAVNSFREPITVHQISNMLHTLVGERPVPSFRTTFYKADTGIFNIANRSYLKITSPKQIRKLGGEDVLTFLSEMVATGKSVWNSNSKPPTVQWFKVKKYLSDELFGELIELINEQVGYDVLSKPFENLWGIYDKYGDKLNHIITLIKDNKKTPIANFLMGVSEPRGGISTALFEKVVRGVDTVHFLDGEILIPYDDKFVNRLVKNSTNILDGGLVEIVGVFYDDEIDGVDEFVSVSEISDEKY